MMATVKPTPISLQEALAKAAQAAAMALSDVRDVERAAAFYPEHDAVHILVRDACRDAVKIVGKLAAVEALISWTPRAKA